MTPTEFFAKWQSEADMLEGAQVQGATLLRRVLADFRSIQEEMAAETLSLREAAIESGYSPDHLGRLVRTGSIPNAGRRNAPRIRRTDLPRKTSPLTARSTALKLYLATPRQIARSVVTSKGVTDE